MMWFPDRQQQLAAERKWKEIVKRAQGHEDTQGAEEDKEEGKRRRQGN